jgi:hypothetical protein
VLDDPAVYIRDVLNAPQQQALIVFWEAWLKELQTIRVVDPACGSGAFLIEAFDQLFADYQRAVEHLSDLERGQVRVFDPDRSILQHNLYGVDLNEEAIQIARLSIWIKTAQRGKVLTDLDHNIRPGNSLVSDAEVDPRAFDWQAVFPEVFEAGGFDVVLGNPPYVRAEQITALKPYLQQHFETYHGSADLYTYFYELGLKILKPGGYLSYIVTNKWLKSSYGEPLRHFYSQNAEIQEIIDFGHAPIFPDADVFPCILVLRKPAVNGSGANQSQTRICLFPREELGRFEIPQYVEKHGYAIPASRFGGDSWSLEHPGVEELLAKVQRSCVPLREYLGLAPLYGIKTGLNEAFLIDTPTRERLVREDARSAEIIKPYLRGQDLKRWTPQWADLWMIVLRSGENHAWPWTGQAAEDAEQTFGDSYPAVYAHMSAFEARLRSRQDQGQHWWELRSCAYYEAFEQPKLCIQRIAFHPRVGRDDEGMYLNDSAVILPSTDPWVLACLNSPVMWYYSFRYLPHKKDEALAMDIDKVVLLPIPAPTDAVRNEAEHAVDRLISLAHEQRGSTNEVLTWLLSEFGIDAPGQKLDAFATLTLDSFLAEVRKRRPRGASTLTPKEVSALRSAHVEYTPQLRQLGQETRRLERRLAALVNNAYGLTSEEVQFMWETAPPRMPGPHLTNSNAN